MILNKIKKIILFGILFFALTATGIYCGIRASRISRELKDQKLRLDGSHKETLEIKRGYDKIQNDYAKLNKDYEALNAGRDKLLLRIKGLLAESERKKELEASLESTKKDMQLLEKAKQVILDQNLSLKEQIKDLETIQRQILKEKEQLQETIEKERDKSGVNKLEQENISLKSAKSSLQISLQQKETEINKLKESESKLKEEVSQLSKQVENLNKIYAEAIKKNKEFEARVGQLPSKFAELARQNKLLIKRTANMHYNMGVFYTQQKEYSRAVAEFEKAVELVSDDAYAHFNLGYIYAEYLVNRPKAIEHFRQYLRGANKEDKDVDWVKKYIITWESFSADKPLD